VLSTLEPWNQRSGCFASTRMPPSLSTRCSGHIQSGTLTDLTLGLNWYYAVRSRVMFNYIHAFLDRDSLRSNADIFAMRFQFAF